MVICRADGIVVCPIRVGDILMTDTASNPNTTYIGTTWQQVCVGRVPVGVNTSDSDFNTINKTGGAKTVQLSVNEMPVHSHSANSSVAGNHTHADNWRSLGTPPGGYHKELNGLAPGSSFSDVGVGRTNNATIPAAGNHSHTITVNNSGGGSAHENMPPYQTKYFWKRLS